MGDDQKPQPEGKRSIDRELRRGSIELAVLHVLSWGEAYGYEIVTKLVGQTNGAIEITDGTLYPVLYRLEAAGLVDVRWETQQRGVPRKYYSLTKSGKTEHDRLSDEWIAFAGAMTRLLRQPLEGI